MTVERVYQQLLEAASLEGDVAALRITATYEPVGGSGSRIYPPTYPAATGEHPLGPQWRGTPYLVERRHLEGAERTVVLLDGTASQANRAEQALLRARGEGRVAIPLMQVEHNGQAQVVLTALDWPHRWADAYARDSELDGVAFDKSSLGKSLCAVTPNDATALYAADPGSLVYGSWDSHRAGRQVKFPRIYSSEVIGLDAVPATRNAGRMDPVNLSGAAKHDGDTWEYVATSEKVKGEKLSEIGHGNIAPNPTHGGVTVTSARRMATISFAGLDRIRFGSIGRDASLAARVVLAAYALLADRLAFGRPSVWLRSGAELVLVEESIAWVRRGGQVDEFELSIAEAIDLLALAVKKAEAQGISWNEDTVVLTPNKALGKAIDFALTKAAAAGE